MTQETVILPKMTAKTLGLPAHRAKDGAPVELGRIYGEATGIITNEIGGDLLFGLKGQFFGDNYHNTEKTFQSGKLYLPGGVNEMLVSAVEGEGVEDDKGRPIYNAVKFAFSIRSVPSNNPAGYSYEVTPVIDAVQSDLQSELQGMLPPPPKVDPLPVEEKAKAKA